MLAEMLAKMLAQFAPAYRSKITPCSFQNQEITVVYKLIMNFIILTLLYCIILFQFFIIRLWILISLFFVPKLN